MAQQFQLPDGRYIDYAVHGPQDGFPLLWIHGTPGAYSVLPEYVVACEKREVKMISLSRAGYGGSTRNKGRQVIDAVADLQALNEYLGVERCVVAGFSGGGPHALACGARLPGCAAVLCGAGVAPYDAEGLDFLAGQGESNIEEFNVALRGEEELQNFCAAQRVEMLEADIAGLIEALGSVLPPVDKEALTKSSGLGDYMVESIQEALRINCDGWVDDDLAFTKPWGFQLSEVTVPVLLYQGTEDKMVPYAHGEWFAKHLPQENLKKHLLKGEGHVSILVGRSGELIDELLEVAEPWRQNISKTRGQ